MSYISAELRKRVTTRANHCCEYCLLGQEDVFFRFEIDHVIAEKHGGATLFENLCLACPDCNAFKGSDIASLDPQTKRLTPLFNPRKDHWYEHFRLNAARIEPLTAQGRVTVFLLKLNTPDRITDRQLLLDAARYPCTASIL